MVLKTVDLDFFHSVYVCCAICHSIIFLAKRSKGNRCPAALLTPAELLL